MMKDSKYMNKMLQENIKMSNRKWIFINLLTKETELSYDEAKIMIESLPEKYLDKAITKYYRSGVHGLRSFIDVIIRFGTIK